MPFRFFAALIAPDLRMFSIAALTSRHSLQSALSFLQSIMLGASTLTQLFTVTVLSAILKSFRKILIRSGIKTAQI